MSKQSMGRCCWVVVIFPVIFYAPKFLEYRYEEFVHTFSTPINCTNYVNEEKDFMEDWVSVFAPDSKLCT